MHDREQTEELFERLGEGWTITTVLGIQPWGDHYGKLTDRCGWGGCSTAPDDGPCDGDICGEIAVVG